jgi:hypothetical protein
MDNTERSAEPDRELVEWPIVDVLEIAQRQGIAPVDFIQLLDSGMRIPDFLAALIPGANGNRTIDSDSWCSIWARPSVSQEQAIKAFGEKQAMR